MEGSQIEAIRSRLLHSNDSKTVLPNERPIVIRELTRLLVSRTLLREFVQGDSETISRQSRLFDDYLVIKTIEGGLEVLSNGELGLLVTNGPDLKHLCECIYGLGGEHKRASCWWEASVAEGERLMDASGKRAFHERAISDIKRGWKQ